MKLVERLELYIYCTVYLGIQDDLLPFKNMPKNKEYIFT